MKKLNNQELNLINGGKKKKSATNWIECGVGTITGAGMGGLAANPATIIGGGMMGAASTCF